MSARPIVRENLRTLHEVLCSKPGLRSGRGDLGGVIESIAIAGKSIAHKVRRARVEDVLGKAGDTNVQGEEQEKLDVLSNQLLIHCLSQRPDVALIASEEEEVPTVLRSRSEGGEFCVLFDPLDGSSNIDVAVGVGTIFSVLRNRASDELTASAALQAGSAQVASGYILYGSSVLMILCCGAGVDMFVLDPLLGDFVLVESNLRMPEAKKIYSINEAYRNTFSKGYNDYLEFAHANGYAARYVGSMVADVHRTLIKGGVFLYPPTKKDPSGKLRLLYEANPISLLVEQAGGLASTGAGRILEIEPREVHQRTPVLVGSKKEVEQVLAHLAAG
jgi:fructose-1,6-bisphosphatase I